MSTCMLFNGNIGFKIPFKRPLPFVVMQCLSWRKKLQHVAHYQGLVFDSSDQVWMKLNATVKIYWSSSQPISILEKSELILNLNKKTQSSNVQKSSTTIEWSCGTSNLLRPEFLKQANGLFHSVSQPSILGANFGF